MAQPYEVRTLRQTIVRVIQEAKGFGEWGLSIEIENLTEGQDEYTVTGTWSYWGRAGRFTVRLSRPDRGVKDLKLIEADLS